VGLRGLKPKTSLCVTTSQREKGLDFGCKRSVSVAAIYGPLGPSWIPPRWRCRHCGASVVTALDAVATERIQNVAQQNPHQS